MQFFKDRIKSFRNAFNGMRLFFKLGAHARIHAVAAIIVVCSGIYLKITISEWCFLIVAIAMVLAAEAFNTAIEELSDMVEPNFDKRIGRIKDISAAAVLFLAFGSLIIGGFVFLPRILSLFQG